MHTVHIIFFIRFTSLIPFCTMFITTIFKARILSNYVDLKHLQKYQKFIFENLITTLNQIPLRHDVYIYCTLTFPVLYKFCLDSLRSKNQSTPTFTFTNLGSSRSIFKYSTIGIHGNFSLFIIASPGGKYNLILYILLLIPFILTIIFF